MSSVVPKTDSGFFERMIEIEELHERELNGAGHQLWWAGDDVGVRGKISGNRPANVEQSLEPLRLRGTNELHEIESVGFRRIYVDELCRRRGRIDSAADVDRCSRRVDSIEIV